MVYEITVVQTKKAYNLDDCMPAKAKRYISETFSGTNVDANVSTDSETPDPPTEKPHEDVTYHPCDGSTQNYGSLAKWFYDYIRDCSNLDETKDAIYLCTKDSGLGGVSYGNAAVGSSYQLQYFDCLSGANSSGCATRYDAMHTAPHEIGHSLGLTHQAGNASESNTKYTNSPMINDFTENNDGTDNACNNPIEYIDTTKEKCHRFTWSNCSESKL